MGSTYLIDGDPVLHAVAEAVKTKLSVAQKVKYNLLVVIKAAVSVLKLQRVIPVKDGDPRCDAGSEKRINLESESTPCTIANLRDQSSTGCRLH
jgi:hypothetical protein